MGTFSMACTQGILGRLPETTVNLGLPVHPLPADLAAKRVGTDSFARILPLEVFTVPR